MRKWLRRRGEAERERGRLRADLESKGVARESSESLAERLGPIVSDLSPEAYAALLDGVTAAFRLRGEDRPPPPGAPPDLAELQRLMQGFAGELRKLDEGLRILSAYVSRMRTRATRDARHTLH